jgi:hypothetical protein
LSFPYVCPEPVLASSSFLYINGSKVPFFAGAELKSPICQASLIKLLEQLGDPDPEHALHTIK